MVDGLSSAQVSQQQLSTSIIQVQTTQHLHPTEEQIQQDGQSPRWSNSDYD